MMKTALCDIRKAYNYEKLKKSVTLKDLVQNMVYYTTIRFITLTFTTLVLKRLLGAFGVNYSCDTALQKCI